VAVDHVTQANSFAANGQLIAKSRSRYLVRRGRVLVGMKGILETSPMVTDQPKTDVGFD